MEICYIIAFPDADDGQAPAPEPFKGLKDAPYFQPVDIDLVTLGEETLLIEGHAVAVIRQRYDGRVQMIECRFELKDPFAVSVLQERAKIQSALESRFIPTQYRQNGLYEEYTILLRKPAHPRINGSKKTPALLPNLSAHNAKCLIKKNSTKYWPHARATLPWN
jgi:hypothetical protein